MCRVVVCGRSDPRELIHCVQLFRLDVDREAFSVLVAVEKIAGIKSPRRSV